jgi:hypothetical protein
MDKRSEIDAYPGSIYTRHGTRGGDKQIKIRRRSDLRAGDAEMRASGRNQGLRGRRKRGVGREWPGVLPLPLRNLLSWCLREGGLLLKVPFPAWGACGARESREQRQWPDAQSGDGRGGGGGGGGGWRAEEVGKSALAMGSSVAGGAGHTPAAALFLFLGLDGDGDGDG